MPSVQQSLLFVLSALSALGHADTIGPWSLATPGGPADIIITKQNTLNSTSPLNHGASVKNGRHFAGLSSRASGSLPITLNNNYNGAINAYISGLDPSGAVVMLGPNSQWYYPQASGSGNQPIPASQITIPLNSQGQAGKQLTLPTYVSSGRIWFAAGSLQFFTNSAGGQVALVQPSAANPSDPSASTFWGFCEFTNSQAAGLYINPSQVDFAGLPVGISAQGNGQTLSTPGLRANSLGNICNSLKTQSNNDSQPWNSLCVANSAGTLVRALSPNTYRSAAWNSSAFNGYYEPLVKYSYAVWAQKQYPLIIDAGPSFGNVTCGVVNGNVQCNGDSTSIGPPSTGDFFSCATGPLQNAGTDIHKAIVARFCAGYIRESFYYQSSDSTYYQPSVDRGASQYYNPGPGSPCDFYGKFVHANIVDGRGYTFPYDDVTPTNGQSQDGTLTLNPATSITVTVGGS